MKIYLPLLGLGLLLGCQSNSTTQTPEKPSPATATQAKSEARRQADVLQKDTLNAVQEEVVRKPSPKAEDDFEKFFKRFEKIIKEQDRVAFNQLIDPELGLYLIDTPGAMPQFTRVTDIATFKRADQQQRPFFTISETFKDCRLKEVKTLPKVTCEGDAEPYSDHGCFVADATAFRKNEAYKYASLSPEEEKTVGQTQLLVQKTVLHTASGFKFHFGQIKGQWKVLFIDLMRPCSA
ncbi:hypothetical protein [Rufibacter soli]